MCQNKLVTVIIPTFKRADELKKALTSVLLQDFKSLDIIIVDDNVQEEESNKVKEICVNFAVNYIKNFRRKGGCGSRNSGILSTSSKYIAFLDDDDLWLANKLETQSTFLEKNASLCELTRHSSAKQAATIAKLANVGKLILGHYSTRYDDLSLFKTEAEPIFSNVELADDGKVFEI